MPILNNEVVNIGDKVYDVAKGYGSVVSTQFNEIQVRFNDGQRITYDSVGKYAGVKRLYWHNPVVIEPTKDNKLWGTLVNCLKSIHQHLST